MRSGWVLGLHHRVRNSGPRGSAQESAHQCLGASGGVVLRHRCGGRSGGDDVVDNCVERCASSYAGTRASACGMVLGNARAS